MANCDDGTGGRFDRATDGVRPAGNVRQRGNRSHEACIPNETDAPLGEASSTVFVVDQNVDSLRRLRGLMESVELNVETYEAPEAFLDSHDPSRPGCCILEVRFRNMSGIELHRRLRREGNPIPVIFLTAHGDIPTAVQALREGAFHFLEKPVSEQYLLDQTQAAIAQDLQDRRAQRERRAAIARFEGLSERERTVLAGIAAGKSNKQVAHRLGLSVKTVEFHRANILKKVGVESIAELVRLLMESELNERMDQTGGQP